MTKIINTDESHSEELGKLSGGQEKFFTPGSSQRSSIDSVGFVGSDKDSYPTNSPPTSEGSNHATEQKSEGSDRSSKQKSEDEGQIVHIMKTLLASPGSLRHIRFPLRCNSPYRR